MILPHFTSALPLFSGIFERLFFAIILTAIEKSPRLRAHFPIGLSAAWISCSLYAVGAATAVRFPYIHVVSSIAH
jgi:hypothetical protein